MDEVHRESATVPPESAADMREGTRTGTGMSAAV